MLTDQLLALRSCQFTSRCSFFFLLIAVPFASFFLSPVVATAIVFTLLLAVRVERERWKRKRKRRKRTFLIVCGPVEGGADKHHSVCRAVNIRKGEKEVFFLLRICLSRLCWIAVWGASLAAQNVSWMRNKWEGFCVVFQSWTWHLKYVGASSQKKKKYTHTHINLHRFKTAIQPNTLPSLITTSFSSSSLSAVFFFFKFINSIYASLKEERRAVFETSLLLGKSPYSWGVFFSFTYLPPRFTSVLQQQKKTQ